MAVGATLNAVEVAGLVKSFGDVRAVDGVNLVIPAGSFYGIAGPNGAGKTTSIRMITGLLQPDAGSVTVGGVPVWPNPREAKQRLGFVPDNPSLFDRLTAAEMLQYAGLLRRPGSGRDSAAVRRAAAGPGPRGRLGSGDR